MNLAESLALVTECPGYQKWKKNNQDAYLCSFFCIRDGKNDHLLQVDFYNVKNDTISSFVIDGTSVTLQQDGVEALKKEGEKIEELHLEKATMEHDDALQQIESIMKERYAKEKAVKVIMILQCKGQARWNLSVVTSSLHLLNVKIDAATGKILEEGFHSLMQFTQRLGG